MGAQVVVLGASGYAGGEVLRLLSVHPGLSVASVGASGRAGAAVGEVHPQLTGAYAGELVGLDEAVSYFADVCISCLPSGVLPRYLKEIASPIVVDLADDFRSDDGWTYGLTEHARSSIAGSARISGPGCYPTATLLALIPFARAGAIEGPVIVDAMSGVSGAGRKLDEAYLFTSLHGSVTSYGSTDHRHVPEIERGLARLGDLDTSVSFTPHLVPMSRGLLATCRARLTGRFEDADVIAILEETYADEYFVDVSPTWPATRAVMGTNRAIVSARVDRRNDLLVASAAIDNLGKGAAGQAIQNVNCALGFEETAGLEQLAPCP